MTVGVQKGKMSEKEVTEIRTAISSQVVECALQDRPKEWLKF